MIIELESDIDLDNNQAACLPYESSTYPKFKSTGVTVYSSSSSNYDLNLANIAVSLWYSSLFSKYRYTVQPLLISGCQSTCLILDDNSTFFILFKVNEFFQGRGAPLFTLASHGNEVRFVLAGIALHEGCTIVTSPFQEYAQLSEADYFQWIKSNVLTKD